MEWIQFCSGKGPVTGCCEHGDKTSDSGATELVSQYNEEWVYVILSCSIVSNKEDIIWDE